MLMFLLAALAIALSLRVSYLEGVAVPSSANRSATISAITVNPPVNGGPGGRVPGGSRMIARPDEPLA